MYTCLDLQDGSDTICLGVDTLNTETQEVRRLFLIHMILGRGDMLVLGCITYAVS